MAASRDNASKALRAEARTDFAAIKSNVEFIMIQLAGVPAWKQLARYSLLVMVGTAATGLGRSPATLV